MSNEETDAHRRMQWTQESWDKRRKKVKERKKRKLGEN